MSKYTPIPSEELKVFEAICSEFKTVIDVGSRDNLDYFYINSDCSFHLFEPMGEALASIKSKLSNISKHDIKLNEYGLSDKNLDNQVYYDNTQSFTPNSFVRSVDRGSRYSLRKLDDYVKNENIDYIDFLKIDVEGLDYNVILGGLNTIRESNKVH